MDMKQNLPTMIDRKRKKYKPGFYSNIENHVLWAWSESLGCAIK